MRRMVLFYILTLAVTVIGIAGILYFGKELPRPESSALVAEGAAGVDSIWSGVRENLSHPLSRLFLQLLVILVVSRVVGRVFARFGQPSVVGEMLAGVLLGPSLLGLLAPGVFEFVFSRESLMPLNLLSQIGVCLFMFVVGMEVDMRHVRSKAGAALLISHASIVFPCLLGVALAYFLYSELAGQRATFAAFGLFMGVSMALTAFPILARILQERNLSKTPLGNTAITCAAVADVKAWILLAFVVAIAGATGVKASVFNLALVVAFIAIMVWGVRPALPRCLGRGRLAEGVEPTRGMLALVVCVVIAASLATEVIGIHALFGSFLAGAIMPDTSGFRHKLSVRVENFSSVLLLPLFFAFTGLRTQIGLMEGWQDWLICGLIIAMATFGKLGGSAFAARFTGMSWRESLQLGALMNTRALMELIVLNMGYDLGILSDRIFTMLVLMALITTFMTGPLLTLFGGRKASG